MVFCPNCGTELDDLAKFCLECGTPLNKYKKLNSNENLDNKDSLNEEPNEIEKTSKIDEDNVDCTNCEKEMKENVEICDDVEKKKNNHILNNKNKKYVVYGVIAIIGIIAIIWVANELYYPTDSYTDEIDGMQFQIPAGYKVYSDYHIGPESSSFTTQGKWYKNSQGDILKIVISTPINRGSNLWTLNATKTIKNHEGVLYFDKQKNDNVFEYLYNDQCVVIRGTDKNLNFENIIIQ